MASDLTENGGGTGSLTEVPDMSPELRKLVDRTETIARYGGDEGPPADGANLSAGRWIPPAWVPDTVKAEAGRQLLVWDRALIPASPQVIVRWLNYLFIGCAKPAGGGHSWDGIKLAYPAMLEDQPAAAFTKRTLMEARNRFKFFPSCNEIVELLSPHKDITINTMHRLRTIAGTTTNREGGPASTAPRMPRTDAEKAEVSRICAGISARLDAVPFKASLRPEDDAGFKPIGDAARNDVLARKDPAWATFLETSRRIRMARAEADKAGDANGWARFMVPLDQPLADDLRARYGHLCPGHDPAPAPPADRGAAPC